jgi:hypothetical protein
MAFNAPVGRQPIVTPYSLARFRSKALPPTELGCADASAGRGTSQIVE